MAKVLDSLKIPIKVLAIKNSFKDGGMGKNIELRF
jgi:hypothetical protein